jgi:uncharacterized protein YjbI with pentapeptide repeats
MANPEHLEILKQGVEVWNQWRIKNLDLNPDLSDANFDGLSLGDVNFISANLSGASFSNAYLLGASFSYADLDEAEFSGAHLAGADLSDANLLGATFVDTDLSDTDLTGANLIGADLSGARLYRANLHGANLFGAIVKGASLSHTKLSGTHTAEADFTNVELFLTVFADMDLSRTKGLDLVKHAGPSTIGVDTIYKSGGNVPDVFLRGCGVPDTFITFAKSLIGTAIDYYSAFISYSSKNHDFAERLYADLQSKGVRCWFAPEDIKIGDKFRQRIDEAIRIHDKLLVVLSEESINSAWVEEEVESAIEREHREKRLVLFPIRIDEAVIDSGQAWAASLRRMRHIGDFSKWKDHDSYSKAFDRLLRDLKAE